MPRRSGIPSGRLPWRPSAFSRLVVCLLAWGPVLAQAEIPGAQASSRRDVAIQPTALAGATSLYANSWAVVIGINEFQNPKVSRLNYAVNDANSVTQVLQALGFPEANIIKLLNRQATRAEIERILLSVLRRRAGPQDRVVVFFATHGVTLPLPSGGEESYLLPFDTDPDDLPLTAFSMSQIKLIGQRLPAKHTLVAVDACYGGYSLVRAQAPPVLDPRYLALISRSRALQVLTAGKKDQPVIEDQGHGVFTRKLLDGLAGHADTNNDGLITLSELGAWLHPRVAQASEYKQEIQWGNLDGEGQFVFLLPQGQSSRGTKPGGESTIQSAATYGLDCHAATERRPTSDLGSGWCHSEIARPRGGEDPGDPGRLSCGGPHPRAGQGRDLCGPPSGDNCRQYPG